MGGLVWGFQYYWFTFYYIEGKLVIFKISDLPTHYDIKSNILDLSRYVMEQALFYIISQLIS